MTRNYLVHLSIGEFRGAEKQKGVDVLVSCNTRRAAERSAYRRALLQYPGQSVSVDTIVYVTPADAALRRATGVGKL